MNEGPVDLFTLDREVRRAAQRTEQLRARLATGTREERAKAKDGDPFAGVRDAATKSTYDALVALTPSLLDVPLRDGLLRWVHELLQQRVGLELQLADADAETEPDPRLTKAQAEAYEADEKARGATGVVDDPRTDDALTYRQALRGILHAPNEAKAAAALARAGELAIRTASVRKERRARRFEAARRLGLAHPWSLATKLDVRGLAQSFLDASEPLAAELFARAQKGNETPWRASSAMQLALGHGAQAGWPAHLGARWLDETFAALSARGVPLAEPPRPLGSATFLRAAAAWGFALRVSSTPRVLPFALARDPYPASAHRFAYALASAVTEPGFQRRALELPSRTAAAQSRVLRQTMFLYARVVAARGVLLAEENVTAPLFEEITARVFGAPLPATMRDAWPDPRSGTPAEVIGLFGTLSFVRDLVSRYDEDWYRNPAAGRHLVGIACGPAFDPEPHELPERSPETLARLFEETLG